MQTILNELGCARNIETADFEASALLVNIPTVFSIDYRIDVNNV